MVGGHVSLQRALHQGGVWYATLARGYKAGGFNIGTALPEARRTYGAEYLWNLETGVKTSFADGRVSTETALFYMRRADRAGEHFVPAQAR